MTEQFFGNTEWLYGMTEWLDGMTGCQGECDLSSTWVTYSNFEWGPN